VPQRLLSDERSPYKLGIGTFAAALAALSLAILTHFFI
jgi:hypothetical protein